MGEREQEGEARRGREGTRERERERELEGERNTEREIERNTKREIERNTKREIERTTLARLFRKPSPAARQTSIQPQALSIHPFTSNLPAQIPSDSAPIPPRLSRLGSRPASRERHPPVASPLPVTPITRPSRLARTESPL